MNNKNIKITISGGYTNYTDTYNKDFYMCEAIEAEKIGIDLSEYNVLKSIPGLRKRASVVKGGNGSPACDFNTSLDGYELWITKKK